MLSSSKIFSYFIGITGIFSICAYGQSNQNCNCDTNTVTISPPCGVTVNDTTGDVMNTSQLSQECQCTLLSPYEYSYTKGSPYLITCYTVTTSGTSTTSSSSTSSVSSAPTTTGPTTTKYTGTTTQYTGTTTKNTGSTTTGPSTTENTGPTQASTQSDIVVGADNTTDEDPLFFGACNTTVLSETKHKIVKILMYFASIWVIVCCLITVLITLCYRETGHHRFLNFLQELAFIFLYAVLGFFMWDPFDSQKVCIGATIAYHYTMVLILGFFFVEAIFANSLIKGSSRKNGSIPPFLNYILPFFIAAIPAVVSYFTEKKLYAFTGIHCFVSIYTDLFWAFVAPAWFMMAIIYLIGQLAFLACEQHKPDVDKNQLYWAFKSAKSRPTFILLFLSSYFLLLFAVDMQNFALFIAYTVLTVIFGIFIIIFHTYCYMRTAGSLYKCCGLPPYRPCPPKKGPEKPKKDDPPQQPPRQPVPAPVPPPYPQDNELRQRPNAVPPSNPQHLGQASPPQVNIRFITLSSPRERMEVPQRFNYNFVYDD